MLAKLPIVTKIASNKSCLELNFLQKVSGRIRLSPPGVELGASKYIRVIFEIFVNE